LGTTTKMQKKSMNSPNETRSFENGKAEMTTLANGVAIGRAYLEPGWSWEKCIKPLAKTESCQVPHTSYMISGRMRIKMDDGSEEEFGPGDVNHIPPGHNAWVVGNEPVVAIGIEGMPDFAKK
jgi:mannose-6-phosphate isomerase-like protein (cupin superfamily)